MPLFAFASLTPFLLIALGAVFGGLWPWLALAWITGVTAVLDRLIHAARPPADAREFPVADGLSVALGFAQIAVLVLVIGALADGPISAGKIALFLACALALGQIGNSNAHELIHRQGRFLRRLGVLCYVAVLYGQHASSHVLVHHIRVATEDDPATARRGENLYHFMGRAWWGGLIAGLRAENRRSTTARRQWWRHPYLGYTLGGVICCGLAFWLTGWQGLLWYLALAAAAQAQLLMSDYVQHYGLMRGQTAAGKTEPFGEEHAWNAPHPLSSAMMLNAPRHSDHHRNPARPYPALRLPQAVPMLPQSLPVMAVIALFPPLWRKVMHPRLRAWERRRG